MAKKVFIGATGQNCGKTTISVSLMHLARKKYDRVGFIKPIGPKIEYYDDLMVDMDAVLMAKAFGLEEDIALMSPVALHQNFTRDYLAGRLADLDLGKKILDAVEELDAKYDLLIIEGAGHGGVGSVINLNNARVAKMLDAPVVIVTESGIGRAIDAINLNLALYRQEGADVRSVIMNKLLPAKRNDILGYLRTAFDGKGIHVAGGFNYSPILANPTLSHIGKLLKLPVHGAPDKRSRIIHHIQLGAASSQRVVDALLESTLVVVTGSRDELLVTLASLYHIPDYHDKLAGMVITGHAPVSKISQQILDDSTIPYIRVKETTSIVFTTLLDDVAKITAEDQEKLNWIKANAEQDINFAALDALL
ncbi:MAG: cobyrinic acid a,c-diamide synthase [Geobacter sp.]|nr:MAG: cobyrinic acid a,c-diamide synthase [Geobacter sp.]